MKLLSLSQKSEARILDNSGLHPAFGPDSYRGPTSDLRLIDAIKQGLHQSMEVHENLILMGQDETLYDTTDVFSRIHKVAPSITVEIIPRAKHTIAIDQQDLVNERLLQFL